MILDAPEVGPIVQLTSVVLAIIILTMYLSLTRFPFHHNFLFQDPITGGYGYEAVATHRERRQLRKIQKSEVRSQAKVKPGQKYYTVDQIPEARPARKQKTAKTSTRIRRKLQK